MSSRFVPPPLRTFLARLTHGQTSHHPSQIITVQTLVLPQPLPLSAIFPSSVLTPPAHRDDVVLPPTLVEGSEANASVLSLGLPALSLNGKAKKSKGLSISAIRFIDYRYYRFLLHPDGDFRMVRYVAHPRIHKLTNSLQGMERSRLEDAPFAATGIIRDGRDATNCTLWRERD